MTRKARGKSDPIEQDIDLALNPGAFIPEPARSSFRSCPKTRMAATGSKAKATSRR